MNWVEFFNEGLLVTFLLLFIRLGALFMLLPVFSHQSIPMTVKAAMTFFFAVLFYPLMPPMDLPITITNIVLAILSEFMFGILVGAVILLAFNVIAFAGGIISFVMGFSMATAIDPQSGVSMPIMAQFISLLALMVLLAIDYHHWILIFINDSIQMLPLGGFVISENMFHYAVYAFGNMLLIGLTISVPIIAISWMVDLIFGMLMKSMPQFNMLVIGFPIKIGVSIVVIMAILGSIMLILKNQMVDAFNYLQTFFG